MKTLKPILFLATIAALFSCSNPPVETEKAPSLKSFEMFPGMKDTFNIIDHNGNKQGHWIITKWVQNHTKQNEMVWVEDGCYINNKKEGYWKTYDDTGKVKDSVNYKNDVVVK